MVRSNPEQDIGFLKDWRRMNVAVTRARRMLVVIGNSDCVSVDDNIKSLLEWIGEHGNVISAELLREDPLIRFGLGKCGVTVHVPKERQ
jgi:superfamily I DNA and/or RNA helicase